MLLLIWDIQTFVNGNVSILSNQTIFIRRCLGIESKHGYLDAQTLTAALLDLSPKRLSKFSTIYYCTKIINKTFCTVEMSSFNLVGRN